MDEKNKYNSGIPKSVQRANGVICLNPSCVSGESGCDRCGWNQIEAERRKNIPLTEYTEKITNKDGEVVATETRRRKLIGRRRPETADG